MTLSAMLGLFVATAILGLSPGPAVFATIGRSLGQGQKPVFLFIIGIILGDLVFSLMAMLGLAALAATYGSIFTAVKIIGGLYLMYLGVQSWRDSNKAKIKTAYDEQGWKLVTSGFLLTASNPKDLLFFVGFLPAFMDLKAATFTDMFTASVIIVAAFIITLSFYALLAAQVRKKFSNERSIRLLHKIAGVMLVGVGIMVMFP